MRAIHHVLIAVGLATVLASPLEGPALIIVSAMLGLAAGSLIRRARQERV